MEYAPNDKTKQKEHYSGKKKRHTLKNTLVTESKRRRILALGATVPGSVHDKTDLSATGFVEHMPGTVPIDADLGYTGLEHDYERVYLPKKKPPKGELTEKEKAWNTRLARRRISIEHRIGHVKRYNSTSDVYRNRRDGVDDQLMLICCGLSNYYHRTISRSRA